jgi:hypothetical protein
MEEQVSNRVDLFVFFFVQFLCNVLSVDVLATQQKVET